MALDEMLKTIDFSPLIISLKTGIVSTIIGFFLGIYAAYSVMKVSKRMKWVLDSIFTLPLVLPPTVSGFLLLMLFSLKRPLGKLLYFNFNIKFVQTWPGCVIAACVIAFPLMYRNTRAAFEQIDLTIIYAARTLGMPDFKIFWKVIMPMAAPGILSGTILTFARSIGEYGATSMLAGNILGKTQTIALAIALESASGRYNKAGFWVILILIVSFIIITVLNKVSSRYSVVGKRWR
ncbi:molybdate ABC transporter permease subunit [Anaerosacchariphilus polymeriproducens]|uniref:Molybdenum transport system permease n=2 Tax=Anaerosacchariphilus polymeriproducens TaxID=1812858 RepID=A0A371AUD1_9FIRM|nr:molybdate ABC transporter permease subunit [Anaerosacchariphilus polymeriproducens]RDU23176.1 molybdate ABC transporter permease subunit [Anaerosacchariphilus polymeriproducens]